MHNVDYPEPIAFCPRMRLCAHSSKWQQRPDTLVQKCPSTVKCQRFAGFADCSTRCLKAHSKASLPERTCGFFYWNLIESYRRYKFSHVRGLFSPFQLRAVLLGPFGHRRHHCLCSRPASLERVAKVSGQMLSLSLAGTKAVLNMDCVCGTIRREPYRNGEQSY